MNAKTQKFVALYEALPIHVQDEFALAMTIVSNVLALKN